MIHNVAWYFIEAFTSMFEIIIIYTFLDGFLEKREAARIERITVFVIAFIQLFIVSSFLYNIPNALIVNFLLVSIFLSKILFKGRINTHIHLCFTSGNSCGVTELASVCVLVLSLDLEAEIFRAIHYLNYYGYHKNILSFVAVKLYVFIRNLTSLKPAGYIYFTTCNSCNKYSCCYDNT